MTHGHIPADNENTSARNRIVLAYSGGLEATVAIAWLSETRHAEVVTLTLDLGQDRELAHIRERALAAGAIRAHVVDAREEFLLRYVFPSLRSGAFSPGRPFDGITLSSALIAKRLVEIAHMERAAAVAHGFGGRETSRRRLFEASVHDTNPAITIIAPLCESLWPTEEIAEYARARNMILPPAAADDADATIWGRVMYGPISPERYRLTRPLTATPAEPAFLDLEFEAGVPIRANGVEMALIEMIESIETIAGTHGVGRLIGPDGAAAESPAGVVLHAAHDELSATGADSNVAMNGAVRLKLFQGSCEVVHRSGDLDGEPVDATPAAQPLA